MKPVGERVRAFSAAIDLSATARDLTGPTGTNLPAAARRTRRARVAVAAARRAAMCEVGERIDALATTDDKPLLASELANAIAAHFADRAR